MFQLRKGGGGRPLLSFFLLLAALVPTTLSPLAGRANAELFSPVMQRPNPASLSAPDNVWAFGFRQGAFLGNRMLPLDPFFHRWEGPVHIEERNIVHSRALVEVFAGKGGWEVSLGVREEMSLLGNRDSAEVIRLMKRKQDLPTGNRYDIDLKMSGFVGEELRVARSWNLTEVPGFSVGAGLGLIHGERIQDGTIDGTLSVTGRRAYDFALNLNYFYDVNYLYDISLDRKGLEGYGFATDVGMRYRRKAWDLSLRAEDLLSRIYWRRVNTTGAFASNGRRYFDTEGFVHYDPIITGFEGKRSVTQRIEPKVAGEATYSGEHAGLTIASNWMRDIVFPRAAVGLRGSPESGWWRLGYDLYFRMGGIQYEGKNGGFAVFSDALSLKKIGAAGVQASLRW